MTSHIEELNAPYVKRQFIKICPVCGSNHLRFQFRTEDFSYTHDAFDMIRCQDCEFILTQNPPTQEWIGPYYQSENYISHTDTKEGLTSKLYHLARQMMLRRKFNIIQNPDKSLPHNLLDIGAGTGYFANYAKQKGWEVTGIEVSEAAREHAKSQFGIELLPSEALQDLDVKYTAITLWHVLEHVHDLNESLLKIRALLLDNGKLVIAVPNADSIDAGWYGKYWAAWDVPRHLWHFQPKNMEKLLQKHGFVLKKKLSMPLDAIYVSLLSEKYKGSKLGLLQGFTKGIIAAFWGKLFRNSCSSVIYIAQIAK